VSLYIEVVETTDCWSIQLIEKVDDDVVIIVLRDFDLLGTDRKSKELVRDRAAAWGRRAAKALDVKCHVHPLTKRERRADNQPDGPEGPQEAEEQGQHTGPEGSTSEAWSVCSGLRYRPQEAQFGSPQGGAGPIAGW
jgi:hypothetical protein